MVYLEEKQKGSPLTKAQFINLINQYLKASFPNKNIEVADGWWRSFKQKYSDKLCIRKPMSKSIERIVAEDETVLKNFITNLQELIKTNNITEERIHNIDESPFFWDLTNKKVIIKYTLFCLLKFKLGN